MNDLEEKIVTIEKELRETPYHKGTEHHIGRLKARLAKLKQKAQSTRKKGGFGFALKKSGDATVVLIGPPSVGKSTLLNKLTGARARVEPWPFTTLKVIPGMLVYKGAKIQIFDLPGIIGGAAKGLGRGKEILSAAKAADLMLLMVDIKARHQINSLLREIKQAGVSLSPLVIINKADLLKKPPKKTKSGEIWISAEKGVGLKDLKEIIWQRLNLIRVYLKPKDKEADLENPLILKKRAKVCDVAVKIFPEETGFKKILLWGPSARFPSQQVGFNHRLKDEDILTFVAF